MSKGRFSNDDDRPEQLVPLAGSDEDLLLGLQQMAERSPMAVAALDMIDRLRARAQRAEAKLVRHGLIEPGALFMDDVHPAITNARIAVHNERIMGMDKKK